MTPGRTPTLRFSDLVKSKNKLLFHDVIDEKKLYYTYNGRGAIYQLISSFPATDKKTVLIPAFHCPTVVEPVIRAGYDVAFYIIDKNLRIDKSDLLNKISDRVLAVIIIDYFGFSEDITDIKEACANHNSFIIEDCSHSFLNANPVRLAGENGDVSIFSFWKLIPTGSTGGGLRINSKEIDFSTEQSHIPFKNSITRIKRLFEQAVNNLDGGILKKSYNFLEKNRVYFKKTPEQKSMSEPSPDYDELYPFIINLATAKIPWTAYWLLNSIDLRYVVTARRKNFEIFCSQLEESVLLRKIHTSLPEIVCPWAFPVIFENRKEHDHKIRDMGVPLFTFGETLHPLIYGFRKDEPDMVTAAEYLSENLLCLSVRQDMDELMAEQSSAIINNYIQN